MTAYIIRRILWGIVLLILVSALTFLFFNIFPSVDPAVLRAGRNGSPAVIARIRQELGLNHPIYVQFYRYMRNIFLHFNFGTSYYTGASVLSLIKDRLPATLSLAIGAAIIWLVAGVLIGIISAIKRGTLLDRTAMGIALVFVSMPVFWFGLVLLFLFANDIGRFHIFPGAATYVGLTASPTHWFTSLIMPWIVLAGTSAAIYSRLLRGSLIEAMGEDYIRTARAKGLHRAARDLAPRRPLGDHAGRDDLRSRSRRADGRRGDHRDGLRHPGHRAPELRCDHPLGLPDRPGDRHPGRAVHRGREHHRRHLIRVSRPESPLLVIEPATTEVAPPTGGPLLSVEDLRVSFRTDDGVVHAVDGISYVVQEGRTLGIVGESGSGKTVSSLTTLGLTRSRNSQIEGRIVFQGQDLVAMPDNQLRRIRGNDVSMIFQDPLSSLHPFYKVGWQLVEAMQAHRSISKSAARARAVELLELVGIPDPKRRVEQYPHEFSGGMRQRAMIAMALANEPKLLIADEPTTALDVTVQAQILALLGDLQKRLGTSIIIITHDLGVVAEIADDIAVMYAGRIVEYGTDAGDLRLAPAPVHVGPAEVDPALGQPPRRGAGSDLRAAAEPHQPAERLPFPSALPLCPGGPQAHRPAPGADLR